MNDARDMCAFPALHYGAFIGDLPKVKELLEQGHDINAFDDDIAFTPLHFAANEGHINVVRFLISMGADVNAHDESHIGNTPLGEIAGECSFEMAKVLIDAGADPTIIGWMQLNAIDRAKERKNEVGRSIHALLSEAALRHKGE